MIGATWIKRIAHRLAITLYGAFEVLGIPRIRDSGPKKKERGR